MRYLLPSKEHSSYFYPQIPLEEAKRIYPRYQKADATAKQRILDEFCDLALLLWAPQVRRPARGRAMSSWVVPKDDSGSSEK